MDLTGVELGPKMQACSERERLFVLHYLMLCAENGKGDATEAARLAGYSDPGKDSSTIRVRAHALMHRDRVKEAMLEVGRKEFIGLLFPSIAAAAKLIGNDKHPDHAGTVKSTLSALGLGEKSTLDINLTGQVQLNHTDQAVADLRMMLALGTPEGKLIEIFGHSGLDRYRKMLAAADAKLIEGRADGAAVSDGPGDAAGS